MLFRSTTNNPPLPPPPPGTQKHTHSPVRKYQSKSGAEATSASRDSFYSVFHLPQSTVCVDGEGGNVCIDVYVSEGGSVLQCVGVKGILICLRVGSEWFVCVCVCESVCVCKGVC